MFLWEKHLVHPSLEPSESSEETTGRLSDLPLCLLYGGFLHLSIADRTSGSPLTIRNLWRHGERCSNLSEQQIRVSHPFLDKPTIIVLVYLRVICIYIYTYIYTYTYIYIIVRVVCMYMHIHLHDHATILCRKVKSHFSEHCCLVNGLIPMILLSQS